MHKSEENHNNIWHHNWHNQCALDIIVLESSDLNWRGRLLWDSWTRRSRLGVPLVFRRAPGRCGCGPWTLLLGRQPWDWRVVRQQLVVELRVGALRTGRHSIWTARSTPDETATPAVESNATSGTICHTVCNCNKVQNAKKHQRLWQNIRLWNYIITRNTFCGICPTAAL